MSIAGKKTGGKWYILLAVISLGLAGEKLVLYVEIQQLYKRKMKFTQIVMHMKVTRGTVYTYLNMSFNELIIIKHKIR